MGFLRKGIGITEKGVRGMFAKNFITRRRKLAYPKICEIIDSHVESDFAKSIGTVPPLEEVIDDIAAPPVGDFADWSWTWKNRKFQSMVGISRSVQDFDQTGQVRTILHSMGARLANLPDWLLFQRLKNDTLGNAGDGVTFFSASHTINGTTQSNLLSGTTSCAFAAGVPAATLALQIQSDFRQAITMMAAMVDDYGQPFHHDDLNPENLIIVCGPLLRDGMEQAFNTDEINATRNIYKGKVREIIISNYLPSLSTSTGAANWWLFHAGEGPTRAVMYSRFRRITDEEIEDRIDREFTSMPEEARATTLNDLRELSTVMLETNLNQVGFNASSDVMLNDRFLIKAMARLEIFGGEYRQAVKVENALS